MTNEIAVKTALKMVGIHLPNLSFFPGQDDVTGISIGDPGDGTGNVLVKIDYTAESKKEPRHFMVFPTAFAMEFVQTSDIVIPTGTEVPKDLKA